MIGIYGGTFDPVHFGHLRPALDVMQALQLEQIRFIPCGNPPHREQPVASPAQRLEMLRLAIAGHAALVVDEREIVRAGPSYMVDTVSSLQSEFADQEFCLIVGIDAFNEFDRWREWQTLLQKIKLVVAHRPKYDVSAHNWRGPLAAYVENYRVNTISDFTAARTPAIFFCPVTQLEISSTKIRELLAARQSAAFLLPADVIHYISTQALYC